MSMKKYVHRKIEGILQKAVREFPVVALTGPRQTGKSTLLKKLFKEYTYITMDDPMDRELAKRDPKLFIDNLSVNTVIDEIQYCPELMPYIKVKVDNDRDKNGLYIITGSQVFNLIEGLTETLAGRVAIFELLGFSLEELKIEYNKLNLEDTFDLIFTGFYPDTCVHNVDLTIFYGSYMQTYLERDIRQIRSVHDLTLFQKFIELLSARIGNLLNISEICKECGVSHTTIQNWLALLESTRILYLLKPFYRNITKRVIKRPKVYITDTGLVSYILRYQNHKTLQAGPMSGNIFESMMIIDILKNKLNYNRRFGVYYFRDSNHNEIDLVLDYGNEQKLFEFKISAIVRDPEIKKYKNLMKNFQNSKLYFVNFCEKKMQISEDVFIVPWHQIGEIINE